MKNLKRKVLKKTMMPHKLLALTATLLICFLLLPGDVSAGSSNRISVMSIDAGTNDATAYLVEEASYGGYYSNSWIKQVSSASKPLVMRVGGERIMVLLQDGTLLTKDSPYANWVTQTTGVLWITAGSNGEMMLINSDGNVYSKKGLYDTWVQQTSGGGAEDVAVGGNGRMMVIDSAKNAYSKESTYDAWIKQVNGAVAIDVGASGRMVVINSNYEVYYKDLPTLGWNLAYRPNYPQNSSFWIEIN